MDDAEWLACENATLMLETVQAETSDRKLRLFAVTCVRMAFWWQLTDPARKNAVEVAEQVAEGQCTELDRGSAHFDAWLADGDVNIAGCAAREVVSARATDAARDVVDYIREAVRRGQLDALYVMRAVQFLRCVLGNPFRPISLGPWVTTAAVSVAQDIYDRRDFAALPLLADLLEEAGCPEQSVLDHCRRPGEHARGCWVVDLVLGKS
jgi:hypothetical protein